MQSIVGSVKILTNGLEILNTKGIDVITEKIKEIHGNLKISNIEFENGEFLEVDGLFIALGSAGGIDFAKKIGIITSNNRIEVNENMETNVKGIFACGDLIGGLLQVSKAVYEGAKAGLSVVNFLKNFK